MAQQTYNGWTNYETWNVALWIDNEEGSHEQRREMAQEAWDNAEDDGEPDGRLTAAVYALEDSLKAWVEDMVPDLGATMWADLLGAALSEVNWREIAENWMEDVDKDSE